MTLWQTLHHLLTQDPYIQAVTAGLLAVSLVRSRTWLSCFPLALFLGLAPLTGSGIRLVATYGSTLYVALWSPNAWWSTYPWISLLAFVQLIAGFYAQARLMLQMAVVAFAIPFVLGDSRIILLNTLYLTCFCLCLCIASSLTLVPTPTQMLLGLAVFSVLVTAIEVGLKCLSGRRAASEPSRPRADQRQPHARRRRPREQSAVTAFSEISAESDAPTLPPAAEQLPAKPIE